MRLRARFSRRGWCGAFLAGALGVALPSCTTVLDRSPIVIATGGASGVNYPLGASVCRFFNFDMRFGYRVPLSKARRVEIAADVFNLTNRTNFAIPGGNQNAPTTFLVLTAYNTSYSPRKLQVGARIVF